MNWESASHFWAMGGYGFFVWASYGVTGAVIAFELIALSRRMKRARAQVKRDATLDRIEAEKRGGA
ncbi:heme exporter protein CcmD [Methyloversatilis universalis]|uniref:heme exporter protein CcmD n=1 Tax=Methyloversatilis universalis TaxID=378211 RepID=UPI00035EA9E2|nr:heme exporter protein CcmD [Methyloversatilis universalis]